MILTSLQYQQHITCRFFGTVQVFTSGWGISKTLAKRVIILEEDLQISPDFFNFFSALSSMLDNDDTLLGM